MDETVIKYLNDTIKGLEEKQKKLIGKQKIVNGDVYTANTNINHLKALKEMLDQPENKELLEDEPYVLNGKTIYVPSTRAKLYDYVIPYIKNPRNIYLYSSSVIIKTNKKDKSINKYFNPEVTSIYDYDNNNVLGKIYINLENPTITSFVLEKNCKWFESKNKILIMDPRDDYFKDLMASNNPKQIRFEYITELLENGYEAAEYLLSKYYIILDPNNTNRTYND
ncbi:MAG: hypothetical protein J5634_01620 [Bacilli bacterium]|nr:hypothetical protein [Bacilli bacterium]